jgi:2-methylisocitrate lyase-like PEP mutase family enzyme
MKVLERAGAAGLQIEDQVFPKKCGHFDGKEVVPLQEMLAKIKAAADTRRDGDLQIVARTDARAVLHEPYNPPSACMLPVVFRLQGGECL